MAETNLTHPRDINDADLAQSSLEEKKIGSDNKTSLTEVPQLIIKIWNAKMGYIIAGALCLCAFLVISIFDIGDCSNQDVTSTHGVNNNNSWDYLRLTQQWPPAVCVTPETQKCAIPAKSQFWTVHGIWPDRFNDTKNPPANCNNSWHFKLNDITSIKDKMAFMWPDLINDKPSKSLWIHEWTKHGTCAASLPELNSILKYFSKGIDLWNTFNLLSLLSAAGIKPDTQKTNEWSIIQQAFVKALGHSVRIDCSFKHETRPTGKAKSVPLLSVVGICFDKNFQVFDCPDSNSTSCPKTKGLVYLPITPEA